MDLRLCAAVVGLHARLRVEVALLRLLGLWTFLCTGAAGTHHQHLLGLCGLFLGLLLLLLLLLHLLSLLLLLLLLLLLILLVGTFVLGDVPGTAAVAPPVSAQTLDVLDSGNSLLSRVTLQAVVELGVDEGHPHELDGEYDHSHQRPHEFRLLLLQERVRPIGVHEVQAGPEATPEHLAQHDEDHEVEEPACPYLRLCKPLASLPQGSPPEYGH